ncbi:receptor like protein kinase S.2-like [Miscanthus floridulus]|uniref:receptor like protein kinase S.2-like n=1 Tax=Miscanthus floridulus TaxID=154761 RepID=UPI0034597D48
MELPENKLTDFIKSSEKAKWIPVNNHNVNNFTEDEIKRITNNYSTPIGQGGFGHVYQGSLDDGTMVAVKKYTFQNLKDGFAKELIVHCQINHKNVVRLLGYCSEDDALMIVTEYVPGGNLKDLLHGSDAPISLDARLRIAIECADALGYMHSSMYQPMIHSDIKPDNILLDNNMGAKLSDFGLSRLLSIDQAQYTMHVIGSRGYMDPEYIETGLLDPKSDVYSFGVVLLELITRAKASENGFSTGLKRNFTDALGKGKLEARKMFDTKIANERDIEILDEIGNLAAQCFTKDIMERPEMKEVLVSLHMLRRSLRREKAQEKIGQHSSSGTLAITQKVDNHGSSIPRSSSNSSVTYKFSILDIFNRKSRMFKSIGGSILKYGGINIFTLNELKRITRNYSTVISEDHTGSVYMGHIDGQAVAVRRYVCGERTFDKDTFVNDMTFASKVRHTNIISLVGCCLETEFLLWVYEFAPRRSLHELLHCYNGTLSLDLRLGIAIGSAQALGYLHSLEKFHGNATSKCILLGDDFVPKVTDIFLARLECNDMAYFDHSAIVRLEWNDVAYIDPVYMNSGLRTLKSDVYSFGIVLLELITRKQPIHKNSFLPIDYIKACRDENSGEFMFDKEIAVEGNIFILEEMGKLAVDCLRADVDERPEIVEVLQKLRDLKHAEEVLRENE